MGNQETGGSTLYSHCIPLITVFSCGRSPSPPATPIPQARVSQRSAWMCVVQTRAGRVEKRKGIKAVRSTLHNTYTAYSCTGDLTTNQTGEPGRLCIMWLQDVPLAPSRLPRLSPPQKTMNNAACAVQSWLVLGCLSSRYLLPFSLSPQAKKTLSSDWPRKKPEGGKEKVYLPPPTHTQHHFFVIAFQKLNFFMEHNRG